MFTIKVAAQGSDAALFSFLWTDFSRLWNESNMVDLLRFLVENRVDLVERFLNSSTTHKVFLNSTTSVRDEVISIVRSNYSIPDSVKNIMNNYIYSNNDVLSEEILVQIYNLIKDNEVDHLETQLDSQQVKGIAQIVFDFYQEDEEVINLDSSNSVTLSILNPVLLSIKRKSFATLKYLTENFDLRQSLRKIDLTLIHESLGALKFNSFALPILLKIKDNEALSFLCRQDGFVISQEDMVSFLRWALADRWLQGLKTFLLSYTAQFYFQSLTFSQRRDLVAQIISQISSQSDIKTKRSLL